VDRILPGSLTLEQYAGGEYEPRISWSRSRCDVEVVRRRGAVEVICRALAGGAALVKRYRFGRAGPVRVVWRWDPAVAEPDDVFASELSLAAPLGFEWDEEPDMWRYPIDTVARSERGIERTRQGDSLTFRWPAAPGTAWIELRP
jgi:hypothetical protein